MSTCKDSVGSRYLTTTTVEKIDFLQCPEHYPDRPTQVDIVETHMAWVFLTESFAYKLKKPVHHPYLDFSTIDARHRDNNLEVKLNRRLAENVYLGVVPLNVTNDGNMSINGPEGRACDWLIAMRRLPAWFMLDRLLKCKSVTGDDVLKISRHLADFYKNRPPIEVDIFEYRERFKRGINENRNELTAMTNRFAPGRVDTVCGKQAQFIDMHTSMLDDRVYQKQIIEGHGDLRPEHISLNPQVAIIDCLQFRRGYRLLDCFDDLAFLALECERLLMPSIGSGIIEAMARTVGNRPAPALIHFYKSYRAMIRTRLALYHLLDNYDGDPEKWSRRAAEYLNLAEQHIQLAIR